MMPRDCERDVECMLCDRVCGALAGVLNPCILRRITSGTRTKKALEVLRIFA